MTLPTYKNTDVLFTVIVRDQSAQDRLIKWSKTSRSISARVDDNRMFIYDHNTLNLFMVTWTHGWDNVHIWDNWTKRHVNF